MQPSKTELAHAALKTHDTSLSMRQRRVLILCDGKRDLAELCRLIGGDATMLIGELQRAGYLHSTHSFPQPPPPPSPPVQAAGGARRRSLVAARMYLLDMLALQRHPTAAQLHRVLQAAREEQDTVHAFRMTLAQLPDLASAGYVQRVRERLGEVLPETHLDAVLAEQ